MERQNRRKEQPKAEASAPVQPAPAPSAQQLIQAQRQQLWIRVVRSKSTSKKRDDFDREEEGPRETTKESKQSKSSEKSKK